VEEVPEDQMEVDATDEYLLPVTHYDKDPDKGFGQSFFIKIRNGQTFLEVKQCVKSVLEVPDKEFGLYKFTILLNNRVAFRLDESTDGQIVDLEEWKGEKVPEFFVKSYFPSFKMFPKTPEAPILGIDHVDKTRSTRNQFSERAVVIHN
jgi:hypothetical protein